MLSYAAPVLAALLAARAGWTRPLTPVPKDVLRPWGDVALALAVACAVGAWRGLLPVPFFALFWLGVAGLSDARCGLLPERWTRFGIVVLVLGVYVESGAHDLLSAACWGVGTAGVLYALRLLGYALGKGAGVGMGDVKLALGLGLAFGTWALLVVYVAFLFAGIIVVVQRLRIGRARTPARVVLGPGFVVGACLYLALPAPWLLAVTEATALVAF